MIRDYQPEDYEAVKDIHKSQGFDYSLPDLTSPLFLVRKVREENGRVVGAMFLRITAEAFLLVQGSPVSKGRSIEELQPEVIREAWMKGIDDIGCCIPPEISTAFIPVLERMGWERDREWPTFYRRTDAEGATAGRSSL